MRKGTKMGPYARIALLCEGVTFDPDGCMNIIRIISRIIVPSTVALPTNCMRKFVFGIVPNGLLVGETPLTIQVERPSKQRNTVTIPFNLPQQSATGYTMAIDLNLEIVEFGLHWINLLFADLLLTRIPLSVLSEQEIRMASVQ